MSETRERGGARTATSATPHDSGLPEGLEGVSDWRGHVIVCGLQPVGVRTVEQLYLAGARVVVIDDVTVSHRHVTVVEEWGVPVVSRRASLTETLFAAGVAGAEAVIVIESTDLETLETVLLVHDLRADVRVVAHLDNPALARAVEEISGVATVLDVASLFAPSVIEASLNRRAHDIVLGATHFVTTEVVAPRRATLRELYGSLVPLGVARDAEQDPIVCPARDVWVGPGDRVTLFGTRDELDAVGLRSQTKHTGDPDRSSGAQHAQWSLLHGGDDRDRRVRGLLLLDPAGVDGGVRDRPDPRRHDAGYDDLRPAHQRRREPAHRSVTWSGSDYGPAGPRGHGRAGRRGDAGARRAAPARARGRRRGA